MSVTITRRVQFNGGAKGRKHIEEARPKPDVTAGRMPRISRLMALAVEMQRLIDEGVVRDYAELARLGHVGVVRAASRRRDPVREHAVRAIAAAPGWGKQRKMWDGLRRP